MPSLSSKLCSGLSDKGRGAIWWTMAAISFPLSIWAACFPCYHPRLPTSAPSSGNAPSQADLICYLMTVFPKNVLLISINLSL